MVEKFVCHSKKVLNIAKQFGWDCGARYTNLRDVKHEKELGFLDIDWKNYDFDAHLSAAKKTTPRLTVAKDLEDIQELDELLVQAEQLAKYASKVIIVPKDISISENLTELIPEEYVLGYSVPTKYGGTEIPLTSFSERPVHLLGGRPDVQRNLANELNVVSIDTNRFTLDASFGDYFDGNKFVPHPTGGYETCIKSSLKNINKIWTEYKSSTLELGNAGG